MPRQRRAGQAPRPRAAALGLRTQRLPLARQPSRKEHPLPAPRHRQKRTRRRVQGQRLTRAGQDHDRCGRDVVRYLFDGTSDRTAAKPAFRPHRAALTLVSVLLRAGVVTSERPRRHEPASPGGRSGTLPVQVPYTPDGRDRESQREREQRGCDPADRRIRCRAPKGRSNVVRRTAGRFRNPASLRISAA